MQKTLEKLIALEPPSDIWSVGSSPSLETLDLGASDAEDLIAIARREHLEGLDDVAIEDAHYDAPTHAYRLLAEIQNPSHISIFLDLIFTYDGQPDEDLFKAELLEILPEYGEAAVAPTLDFLNKQDIDESFRTSCPEILEKIAEKNIAKTTIIQAFSEYLTQKHFTRTLNGLIIASLIDLNASSEIEAIRACYDAHLASINMCGDFEEVEVALGLKEERTTKLANLNHLEKKECLLANKERLGPLSEDASVIERFNYLLDLYQKEGSLYSLFELHAFLTGILLSPIPIPPSQYYPLIWDTDPGENAYTPTWENEDDASFFMQTLMNLHNGIIRELESGDISIPVSNKPDEEEQEILTIWLLKLLAGFTQWCKLSDIEEIPQEHQALISLIVEIMQDLKEAEQSGKRLNLSRDFKDLKTLLSGIHQMNLEHFSTMPSNFANRNFGDAPFSHDIETHHRDTPKISRNAPCPCGSGKKYKRCCMS